MTSRLGTGKSKSFFYGVHKVLRMQGSTHLLEQVVVLAELPH